MKIFYNKRKTSGTLNRTDYAVKNVGFGYACTIVADLAAFATRTMLVNIMGDAYLGVNGLFTNILGVLSFAELGIGSALNFSLYKPVAEKNNEKIKALMQLYKRAYMVIAAIISILGISVMPFLKYLVADPGNVGDIRVYYLIFLFNTVTSYFVSYKYSLVNAQQQNYVFSVLNMITKSATCAVQIIVLLVWRDYLLFLLIGAGIDFIQKFWVARYLNKNYPLLKSKEIKEPLSKQEKSKIWSNVRALIWHKMGDVAVHQTDNIIVSAFINIATVGRVTYYTFFIDAGNQLLSVAFNSLVGSLGNFLSTATKERKYKLFKVYRFLAFWLYGFISIGMYIMLTPIVKVFVGNDMVISQAVIFLMILNFYMMGHRLAVANMKTADGIFRQDQFIAILQAAVNLIVSIGLVRWIGLAGIYVGTVVQGLLATVIRPIVIYQDMFGVSSIQYFVEGAKYLAAVFFAGGACVWMHNQFFSLSHSGVVIAEIILITIFVNMIFFLLFYKTDEFQYLFKIVKSRIQKS